MAALSDTGRSIAAQEEQEAAPYGRCGDSQYIKEMKWQGCGVPLSREEEDNGSCRHWPDCVLP